MLSKRLSKIANLVDENKVVYDVGSDHGLLPCFLVLNNKCPKVYAVDNKEGPLSKAKENIKKYGLEGKVETILSSGIEDIRDDVNIITIAGMGFFTVKSILEGKDLSKYDKLIIQVNKDNYQLRTWISESGYSIIDEEIVFEDHFYEIVVFRAESGRKLSEMELKYGPINLQKKTKDFKDYLEYRKNKLKKVYECSYKQECLLEIDELNDIIEKFTEE